MSEKTIKIQGIDLITLFGANNRKFEVIKGFFPSLQIFSRGDTVQIRGQKKDIVSFNERFHELISHVKAYNTLTNHHIECIFSKNKDSMIKEDDNLILHGAKGKLIQAKTINQRKMIIECQKNDMVFAIGPAGTGKTYTAVALAVSALKKKQVKRIILTRPAVEAGENLGFLPGDLKDKLDPYLQPLYDALLDMLPPKTLSTYIQEGIIHIAPLAFMRGRTLDNSFVILDEAQNSTNKQMKMFLTRMGKSAKFVITGDITQIDLPRGQISGLLEVKKLLKDINGISFVILDERDIIRHILVNKIINAFNKKNKKS